MTGATLAQQAVSVRKRTMQNADVTRQPAARSGAMAAADLSLFAEPGFDPKAWVNSACDRRVRMRIVHAARLPRPLTRRPPAQLPGGRGAGALLV